MPSRTATITAAVVAAAVLAVPGLAQARTAEHPAPGDGVVRAATASAVTPAASQDPDVVVEEAPLVVATEAEATPSTGEKPATVDPGDGTLVADALTQDGRVETDVIATPDAQTIGVTWPAGAAPAEDAQVRTLDDGTWTAWQALEGSDVAPDLGTVDAARTRDGTDSFWIGDADAVQLSFAATSTGGPDDMSLTLVGSQEVAPAGAEPLVGSAASTGSARATVRNAALTAPAAAALPTAVAAPIVFTRDAWGARAQVCSPDVAKTLVGAVLHHTAGSNTYASVAEAMQQIRNDQAYHIDGRGWCDIGYNFIVDKWGNLYEGRQNSLTQPIIGVHAGGFNTGTVGVSMLGEYGAVAPSPAMQEAVARIIGYRLGVYGRNPDGSMVYTTLGGENSRFAAGTTLQLPVVFGHRDVAYTACPGNLGYSTLPGIRQRALRVAYAEPLVRALYHDMLQRVPDPTGLQTWTSMILTGATPASALGTAIAHSREYVQRRVTEAYVEVLGRGPDPQGLEVQTLEVMAGRLRVEDLRGRLIASDEYYLRAGGTSTAYVQRLYRDILHREAAASEVSFWVITIGTRGRSAAPSGVWWSLESAQIRVTEMYVIYLGRGPDPTGFATWAPYWITNGEDALRAGVVGSEEYLARSPQFMP
ncbi:N-acetylmuramoyl-L-alanine amidase [Cellulomonas sp.]|uniref:N-acetylmuramoyl-L-alanine amidase n=1 Tax=Cellulomonas sp. TaxID=40001 RepID=UPI003BAB2F7A